MRSSSPPRRRQTRPAAGPRGDRAPSARAACGTCVTPSSLGDTASTAPVAAAASRTRCAASGEANSPSASAARGPRRIRGDASPRRGRRMTPTNSARFLSLCQSNLRRWFSCLCCRHLRRIAKSAPAGREVPPVARGELHHRPRRRRMRAERLVVALLQLHHQARDVLSVHGRRVRERRAQAQRDPLQLAQVLVALLSRGGERGTRGWHTRGGAG